LPPAAFALHQIIVVARRNRRLLLQLLDLAVSAAQKSLPSAFLRRGYANDAAPFMCVKALIYDPKNFFLNSPGVSPVFCLKKRTK